MKRPHPRPARALSALVLLALAACNQTSWPEHEGTLVENAGADSVKAWPPSARYALPGDVVFVKVTGVRRVYACARVLSFEGIASDSAGATYFTPHARFELPALPDCALSKGLDSVLETTAPPAGARVYFRTPAGTVTDTLHSIAGTGVVEGFLHPPGDTLRVHGRYTFRDSTAAHPRRSLQTDSLEACEILQGATYSRLHGGDTLSIRFRTLLATPLDTTVFPACSGIHADTVEVVRNEYGYP